MKNLKSYLLVLILLLIFSFSNTAQETLSFLPQPTGEYQVGIVNYHWIDDTREETFSDDPNDVRELIVHIHYPADVSEDTIPVPYIRDEGFVSAIDESLELAGLKGIMNFGFEVVESQPTHSYSDVSVSSSKSSYPVLVFSPSINPEFFTNQLEELASHGYIVVSINHPYGTLATLFPDGRKVFLTHEGGRAAGIRAQDVSFVIDQLEHINTDSSGELFAGKIDLGRIGVFGHDSGAATAVEASILDERIVAGVSEYSNSQTLVGKPFLFMGQMGTYEKSRALAYWLDVDFTPLDYSDLPCLPEYSSFEFPVSSDCQGATQLINAYLVAFFDEYVKRDGENMLEGLGDIYPDIILESRIPLSDEEAYNLALEIIEASSDVADLDFSKSTSFLNVLPPEIVQLINLQALWIEELGLTSLPPEIGQLTNLQTLWLPYNELTSLPPEIGQLTNLQTLWLDGNALTSLPPEIGQLSSLQTLNVSNNALTELPQELCNLENLKTLRVDGNSLPADYPTNKDELLDFLC